MKELIGWTACGFFALSIAAASWVVASYADNWFWWIWMFSMCAWTFIGVVVFDCARMLWQIRRIERLIEQMKRTKP